jgi:hypothetical protein
MLDEAPGYRAMFAKTVLTVVLVLGFVAVAWCWTQRFGACEIGNFSENVRLGLNLTAETVKLLLTLSTALAALGGAVMLGLKETPRLNAVDRILMLASTSCFVLSAYFALLWQSWLAEVYYAGCPNLITQPVMRFPFIAQSYSFLFGLVLIGSVILSATLGRSSRAPLQAGGDDNEHNR